VCFLKNGLTLDGTVLIGDTVGNAYFGAMFLTTTQTISGSGSIIFGNNINNNIRIRNNMFVSVNNRSAWGMGGWGPGHWADHWYGHCIPPHHHGWYHGCWSGNWGRNWYAPLVFGATAWGVSAVLPSWGYNYGCVYSNPYFVESAEPGYDYSQPIVINSYNDAESDSSTEGQAPAPESPQMTTAYQSFDQALAAFKTGDYQKALVLTRQAIQKSPQDPVMHEFSALCLFASGDYKQAAAVLNNLLAVAPGMDWTSLSGLYPDVDVYTKQLRALEWFSRSNRNDASAHFVLAYHYLVAGHDEAAVAQLKLVTEIQPGDQVTKRMLDALSPPAEQTAEVSQLPQPSDSSSADAGPTTDLVGSWKAQRDGAVFELTIDENSQFTWKATPKGKPTVTLAGTMAIEGDAILLQSKDQGTMTAQVSAGGADEFQFIAAGSPPDDKGLTFQREKQNG